MRQAERPSPPLACGRITRKRALCDATPPARRSPSGGSGPVSRSIPLSGGAAVKAGLSTPTEFMPNPHCGHNAQAVTETGGPLPEVSARTGEQLDVLHGKTPRGPRAEIN